MDGQKINELVSQRVVAFRSTCINIIPPKAGYLHHQHTYLGITVDGNN